MDFLHKFLQNVLALVVLKLLPFGDPPGSFAFNVFALPVVDADKSDIMKDVGLGVVVKKPLGGCSVAGLALELDAVPIAELLGVAFVGVVAHQAVDAEESDGGSKLLVVGHLKRIAQLLALATVERVERVAVDDYPAEVRAL